MTPSEKGRASESDNRVCLCVSERELKNKRERTSERGTSRVRGREPVTERGGTSVCEREGRNRESQSE